MEAFICTHEPVYSEQSKWIKMFITTISTEIFQKNIQREIKWEQLFIPFLPLNVIQLYTFRHATWHNIKNWVIRISEKTYLSTRSATNQQDRIRNQYFTGGNLLDSLQCQLGPMKGSFPFTRSLLFLILTCCSWMDVDQVNINT